MIGIRLAKLRKESGLSQAKLAEIFDLSNVTIAMYESGKRTPNPDKIIDFCEFFKVSSDYFLGLCEVKNPIDNPFALSVEENKLIELYNELPTGLQADFLNLILVLTDNDLAAWTQYAKLPADDKLRIKQIVDTFVQTRAAEKQSV